MSKADRRLGGARRAQVAQAVLMQAMLGVLLLGLAILYRGDQKRMLLCIAAAIVPAAWAYAMWDAQARDARIRAAGAWTKGSDDRLKRRTYTILGVSVALWLALSVAILVFVR
jgi:hypothetical protein